MSGPLAGKVALVTGARTGLGAATVHALVRAGACVIATGRRPGDCADIVKTVKEEGGEALDLALDVSDIGGIPARVAAALDAVGHIDILVNNAATIEPMAPISALDARAFDAALRVNVTGSAALATALWPRFEGGRIINIVSGAAKSALPGWAAYCASKAALLMLTQSMNLEGQSKGIKAFAFAPGLVDTAMQAAIREARINQISDIPRENLSPPATPARVIAWLASGFADDLAGQYVDIRDPEILPRSSADLKGVS